MTDEAIECELKRLIIIERKTTAEILKLINLAEARDLPLKRGFSSTFDWLTAGLGYSSSAAHRRLQSARLLREVPSAEQELTTGELNLTTLSKAQVAIRASEKANGSSMTSDRKTEVVEALISIKSDQADAKLLNLLPEIASSVHQERAKQITADDTRLTLNFNKLDMDNLAWAVDFISPSIPEGSHGRVLARTLAEFRQRHEKRAIAKAQRKQCEYVDPKTQRRCSETFQIEVDHVVPRVLGGADDPGNKRCLCRQHNQLMAKEWLGPRWANHWRAKRTAAPAVKTSQVSGLDAPRTNSNSPNFSTPVLALRQIDRDLFKLS